MRRLIVFALVLVLLALIAAAGIGWWAWQQLHTPYGDYAEGPRSITVNSGSSASAILADLEAAGVIEDQRLTRAFLIYRLGDPPLQAGEYLYQRPATVPEVLDKLVLGQVVTRPVTLIEGLTVAESIEVLVEAGFGDRQRFLRAAGNVALIADLDPLAEDLEGYLFPDTYAFAKSTSEAQIISTLVDTFKQRWRQRLASLVDGDRTVREVVALASIVEKETQLDSERQLVAGVYAHRLRIGMGLYADPTVIFALKRAGTWDGNIRRADLQFDSPYNTYRYAGLPPGPICSPSLASLEAAAQPADTDYLYFVSRNDGSHVFAASKAEHDRNVYQWQKLYWQRKWRQERAEEGSASDR